MAPHTQERQCSLGDIKSKGIAWCLLPGTVLSGKGIKHLLPYFSRKTYVFVSTRHFCCSYIIFYDSENNKEVDIVTSFNTHDEHDQFFSL